MAEIDLFKDFPKFPGIQKFFEGIGSFIEKVPEGIQEGMKYGSPSTFGLPLEQISSQFESDLSQELAREKAEENLLDPEKLMLLDPVGGGDLENKLRRIRDTDFRKQEEELLQGTNRFPTLSETEKEKSVKDLKEETISEQLLEPRRQERAEDFRAKEQARLQGTVSTPDETGEREQKAVDDGFIGAMKEYLNSSGQKTKSSGVTGGARDLDFYKKEFAKATGVDISGKPDKSNFLMALGLGLMQNRAGKGFNVGKILGAVGESAQKAMPKLIAAQKEAKANMVAAGKYAMQAQAKEAATAAAASKNLNKTKDFFVVPTGGKRGLTVSDYIKNGDNAKLMTFTNGQLAQLQSDPQFNNNYTLLPAENFHEIAKEAIKTPEGKEKYDKIVNKKLFSGAEDGSIFDVNVALPNANNPEMDGKGEKLLENPIPLYRAFARINEDLIKGKKEFAKLGLYAEGTNTLKFTLDNIDSLAGAFGINFQEGLNDTKKMQLIVQKMAIENTPTILGESGKTISDADRKLVADFVANPGPFSDPEVILAKVERMYNKIILNMEKNLLEGLRNLDEMSGRKVGTLSFPDKNYQMSSEEQKELELYDKEFGLFGLSQ